MPDSNYEKNGSQPLSDISKLRLAIDEIDAKILGLVNQRLLLARQIGTAKKQSDIQIVDRGREKEIVERLLRSNKGPLDANGLQRIFEAIIAAGRRVQKTDRGPK